jgi:hypothetical protein
MMSLCMVERTGGIYVQNRSHSHGEKSSLQWFSNSELPRVGTSPQHTIVTFTACARPTGSMLLQGDRKAFRCFFDVHRGYIFSQVPNRGDKN